MALVVSPVVSQDSSPADEVEPATAQPVQPAEIKGSPYLGIKTIERGFGVEVRKIFGNTPAKEAGLKVDDVLISIGGNPTRNHDGFRETLKNHKPGDQVELLVFRDKKKVKLTAIFCSLEQYKAEKEARRARQIETADRIMKIMGQDDANRQSLRRMFER